MPKKEKYGTVVSSKMSKTIVVLVDDKRPHKKYGKIQKKSVRFKAHDPNELCQEGDFVKIVECRPISKD
jgi:small subunit ribosomal protein S17